jgi:hypothetical protein
MSTANKNLMVHGLLKPVDKSKVNFSAVYMPMNTGEF